MGHSGKLVLLLVAQYLLSLNLGEGITATHLENILFLKKAGPEGDGR
jgi:hypothetical protein